ncbi:MAG: hypothetical protein ACR2MD_03195 [Aridibacter sp.]
MAFLVILYSLPMLVLLLLAEAGGGNLGDNASFWAIIALILTFIIDMCRRAVQRRWDKEDREHEKLELRLAIEAAELQAKKDREELARKVHEEAELVRKQMETHQAKQLLALEDDTHGIVDKLEYQEQKMGELDKKVVTLTVADEHKTEVIDAVKENTQKTIENTAKTVEGIKEAHAAYRIANKINEKLRAQQKAGLKNQSDAQSEIDIKEIEDIEKEKGGSK